MCSRAVRHSNGVMLVIFVVALLAPPRAIANAVDICVDVLENITSVSHEYRCGSLSLPFPDKICFALPHCCVPQVCKVSPDCGIAKTITKTITRN